MPGGLDGRAHHPPAKGANATFRHEPILGDGVGAKKTEDQPRDAKGAVKNTLRDGWARGRPGRRRWLPDSKLIRRGELAFRQAVRQRLAYAKACLIRASSSFSSQLAVRPISSARVATHLASRATVITSAPRTSSANSVPSAGLIALRVRQ